MPTAKKPNPPILPASQTDPTGVDAIERRAMQDFRVRFRRIAKVYIDQLNRVPSAPVANSLAVNARYEFQLDTFLLNMILGDASFLVDSILMEGSERELWFFEQYVSVSSARGAAQAFANLANQSPEYRAARGSAANILASEPYQRRMALTRARVFEEMKGLSGDTKGSMARILTDGIGRGLNPREIAANLTAEATSISQARAATIARTEVTMALRRATWDEDLEANQNYGLRTGLLHLSALSSTTRVAHAARHAKIYTQDQVRDWYAEGANAINCKCTQRSILIDEKGNPIVPSIVQRARDTYDALEKRLRQKDTQAA